MRVAIDISSLVYGTGVSTYADGLIKGLSRIDNSHEYVLFAGTLRQRDFYANWFKRQQFDRRFSLVTWPLSTKMQTVIWNDWHMLNVERIIGKFDLYHSVDWSLPPSSYSRIITVHDLFFLKRPDLQKHPFASTLETRLRRACDARLPAIAVSESTKEDLVNLIKYPEELVTVIYEGTEPIETLLGNAEFNTLKSRLGIHQKYLVIVATQEPRKNLARTIEAFVDAAIANCQLVVVGKSGWGGSVNHPSNVIFTGYLPDVEMHTLVKHSKGLLYPSLYEGFGLPILMGFELGVPVLTSKVASMPEVGGDAVIYVDPFDTRDIQSSIQELVNLDSSRRDAMVKKGKKQAHTFSWDTMARETLKVYEKTVAG